MVESGYISLKQANACFSKNDIKCAKTRSFALKTRFMHIISFNARNALGNVQTHWIMPSQANLR